MHPHMHVRMHMHMYMLLHMHMHMHIHMHMPMHMHMHMHVYMHMHMHTHMHAHAHAMCHTPHACAQMTAIQEAVRTKSRQAIVRFYYVEEGARIKAERERKRERYAPRAAKHDAPLLDIEMLSQCLAVGDEIRRVILVELAARCGFAAAALIK